MKFISRELTANKKNRHFGHNPTIKRYIFLGDALKNFPDLRAETKKIQIGEQKAWEKIVAIARKKGEIKTRMTDQQVANIFIFISDGFSVRSLLENNFKNMTENILDLWDGLYNQLTT